MSLLEFNWQLKFLLSLKTILHVVVQIWQTNKAPDASCSPAQKNSHFHCLSLASKLFLQFHNLFL